MGQYKIGDAIRQFLNQSRIKGDIQAMQVEEVWEKVMGKTIARHLAIFDRFNFMGVVSTYDMMHEALSNRSGVFEDVENKRQGYPWNY